MCRVFSVLAQVASCLHAKQTILSFIEVCIPFIKCATGRMLIKCVSSGLHFRSGS
uniref:Uncharacterized protein MANES_06G047100 n=1 Tax=Rhizophora mucronata TaxID=61149 RepID=A0A2P2IXL0_RHIMU